MGGLLVSGLLITGSDGSETLVISDVPDVEAIGLPIVLLHNRKELGSNHPVYPLSYHLERDSLLVEAGLFSGE